MPFRHLNQIFNHLTHWIICKWLVICHTFIWGCGFICVYPYVLVSCSCLFCVFPFSVCDQTLEMKSLFEGLSVFWDWYCPVFFVDVKCTFQYIRSWQWWQCLSVTRYVCFCVCAKERNRQWGEMASVIRFVCRSFVFCSSVGQWITVCVYISVCPVQ